MLQGKKGIIMGVANSRSIATGIAAATNAAGSKLGYSYLPDTSGKMLRRVSGALENLDPAFILPCDVTNDASIAEFFATVACAQQALARARFFSARDSLCTA